MMLDWSTAVVDVSTYQGTCDFITMRDALAPTNLVGAVVRITQGATITDDVAWPNSRAMVNAHLRYRMFYHFTTNDHPSDQFDHVDRWLATNIGGLGQSECLWIDIENNSVTGEALNLETARDLLIMCYQRWPGRVGWYAPRGIANTCRSLHSIFTRCPLWLACPDGNLDQQAIDYNATLLQFDIWPLAGTSRSGSVDMNVVADYGALNELCNIAPTPTKKDNTMILFQMPADVYLWNGSTFVGLGGLGTVYNALIASGVPLVDTRTPEGAEFYARMQPKPVDSLDPVSRGTVTIPEQQLTIVFD